MVNPKFGYAAEKLSAARRMLMAPHPRGEAASYASAFHECMLGLRNVPSDDLDDDARSWRATIDRIMDTEGIEDSGGRGTWTIKAEGLSVRTAAVLKGARRARQLVRPPLSRRRIGLWPFQSSI